MVMSNEVLNPTVLIVPKQSGAYLLTGAEPGTLVISGAKLYVAVTKGTFELVTSA
jgi:hypothetical protein